MNSKNIYIANFLVNKNPTAKPFSHLGSPMSVVMALKNKVKIWWEMFELFNIKTNMKNARFKVLCMLKVGLKDQNPGKKQKDWVTQ